MKKISKVQMGAASAPLILALLKNGDTYGYEIMKTLSTLSNGRIQWKEGSLYPVLKKLESNQMIKSYWDVEGQDRPRKYYRIKQKGIEELEDLMEERELVNSILAELTN